MMLFVSGIYTGEPTEYIVYQNILTGLFLKSLYISMPDIDWYILLLSSVQFVAFSILYFLFASLINDTKLIFILFVIPMLYFIFEFSIHLQFTKVSFIAGITSVFFLVKYSLRQFNRYLIFSLFFLVLAALIRAESIYATYLLASPLLLYLLLKKRLINKYTLFYITILLSTLLSLHHYNNYYYYNSSEKWGNYRDLILAKGIIYYDRSIERSCFQKEFEKHNLSANDVTTFYKWLNDHELYTPERFQQVLDNCSSGLNYKINKALKYSSMKQFILKLLAFPSSFIWIVILFLIITIKRQKILPFIGYFFYFVLILFYIYTMVLNNRVVSSLSLEFYLILLSLYFKSHITYRNYLIPLALILSTFVFTQIFYTVQSKKSYPINQDIPLLKGHYVTVSKSGNYFSQLPLNTNFKELFQKVRFYYLGWNVSSPDNQKVLPTTVNNVYELLINHPEKVILYSDFHRLPVLQQFVLEHYNKKIHFQHIKDNYYRVQYTP
jgi:hypothetical protein